MAENTELAIYLEELSKLANLIDVSFKMLYVCTRSWSIQINVFIYGALVVKVKFASKKSK